ncbi:MAG: PmoA family protein [Sedimentisphaerales bacterium]|nr:PmoA family protein [Sedimentisphaerales bacterium]
MKRTAVVLVLLVLCAAALGNPIDQNVEFIKSENKIDVLVAGRYFTSYVYGTEHTKPMLVPLLSPSGIEVTRRNPLVELKGGSDDHQHHVGIFFAVDNVNGIKFWNNTAPPPQIKHIKITQAAVDNGNAKLATVMHWIDSGGNVLLEENRTMVFLAGDNENEYAIDFSIDLTAKQTEVVFEDIEEGVFAIRVADCLREGDSNLILKPGRPLPNESVSGTGRYFSSNGDETAKNIWGKRARWVALQGIRKGKVVGVAILNHPASINYPTYWHVRSYGLFSANPLGQGDFQRQSKYKKNLVQPLHLTLKKGQKAHFRFLVVVYEGIRTTGQMEKRFREFVE